MAIEIRIPTLMRTKAGGNSAVSVTGSTLGDALADLTRQYPDFEGSVIKSDGSLHRFINIYVNDDDVRFLDKLDTKVSDGDTIALLPAVAGG